jgi:hypothetical protein
MLALGTKQKMRSHSHYYLLLATLDNSNKVQIKSYAHASDYLATHRMSKTQEIISHRHDLLHVPFVCTVPL